MNCSADTFAQMYEAVYKDLYYFALCMMKDTQEAEDMVSASVVAAYENIRRLKDPNAFKSWIFTILANTCKKRLGMRAKQREKEQPLPRQEEPSVAPDYGIAVDVRKAFFILSEEEQEIIALSIFGGYNSKEIGQMMKLNPNTVRSKRSRALEKMECVLQ